LDANGQAAVKAIAVPVAEAADDEFAPESDQAVPEAEAPAEPLEAPVFVRVDFEAWTCDDCVFVTTCDRVGVDRPATCASFQWRAG